MVIQQRIRAENLKKIYQLVNQNRSISRAALSKETNLSKPTVSSLVDELIVNKYLIDCGTVASQQMGRRPSELRVNGTENLVAVISWRRARLDIALITADNKIAFRDQIPLTEEEDKVDKITSTFFNIMKPKVGDKRIMGLCIIIPGIIDAENKRILSTVIGVGYSDPVVQRFEEAFHDYPFCLLNDTACFAYAEYVFANITEPNFAYINVSKGVGACLFANGKMLRGAGSNATQFGHFSIDRNGPLCACGNHGCVERVVGENALTERAEACGIDLTRFTGRKPLYCDIGAMAEDGDAHAKELIKDLAVDLSFAISNLITLFNPSLVVIGGMGVNLGPFFLSNIRDEVQNSGFKEFVSNTWIQYSTLGLDSELGGAARYYIDRYYDFFEQMQGGLYAD